jgi:hypothetical protein
MNDGRAPTTLLVVIFAVCAVLLVVGAYIPVHILSEYGFQYGPIHDRAGNVVGRIRYIYFGLGLAFFVISICGYGLVRSWRQIKERHKKRR